MTVNLKHLSAEHEGKPQSKQICLCSADGSTMQKTTLTPLGYLTFSKETVSCICTGADVMQLLR